MKAMVTHRYGSPDVLELQEITKPAPREDEVLVKIEAAAANAGDWHLLRGNPFAVRMMYGLLAPKHKVLGADIAGRVEVVGSGVERFRPGDEVFGDLSEHGFGAFGEYVSVPAEVLALKPANLSFETAAAVPSAAVTALQGLRDEGHIETGQKVLINGASGGVGTFAVQIAKSFGADVTAVCSTRNVEMARSIGADHVVDYTKEDFTRSGERYDLILDTAAYRPLSDYRRALAPQGTYILVGGSGSQFLQIMLMGSLFSKQGAQRFGTFIKQPKQEDLEFIARLLESGQVVPVIDRTYTFDETAEALRYLEAGHTRGKVVITGMSAFGSNGHPA